MDETGDVTVKDALAKATVKLRSTLLQGTEVLSPNSSKQISIDPLLETYFDIDSPDANIAKQVEGIKTWLEDNGYTDSESQLQTLRQLELRIGENHNPDRLSRIANYVKFRQQAKLFSHKAEALLK